MITKQTAAEIWSAYREIEVGENLLADMASKRENAKADPHAPTLKDAFGQVQHLQLGIPCGQNGHKLVQVRPSMAEAVIRAHIEHKRSDLAEANEKARIELDIPY